MNGMERRLKCLEKKSGGNLLTVSAIIRKFVSPGPDGPVDSGHAIATILVGPNRGSRLDRQEGETMEAFEQRIDEAKSG